MKSKTRNTLQIIMMKRRERIESKTEYRRTQIIINKTTNRYQQKLTFKEPSRLKRQSEQMKTLVFLKHQLKVLETFQKHTYCKTQPLPPLPKKKIHFYLAKVSTSSLWKYLKGVARMIGMPKQMPTVKLQRKLGTLLHPTAFCDKCWTTGRPTPRSLQPEISIL